MLLLRHEPTGISVDLSFIAIPFEQEMIASASTVRIEGFELRLPQPADLIIMKAVAHRPQDMIEVENLLETYPAVDLIRVQQWLSEFAQVLEAPDLFDDFGALLARLRLKGLLKQVFGQPEAPARED